MIRSSAVREKVISVEAMPLNWIRSSPLSSRMVSVP
jgi:hypothetical protein